MVDDDDNDKTPSLEPRTDSISALPREIRAWRRLRLVKRDNSFSLIFFLHETEYIGPGDTSVGHRGALEAGGAPWEEGPPPPSRTARGPPGVDLLAGIFYIF